MKWKRTLSFILSLTMLMGLIVPTTTVVYGDSDGVSENDSFYTSKSIEYNDDGTYTITMEGYAKGQVITTTTEKHLPADIVLVLDTSGSMSEGSVTYDAESGSYSYNDIDGGNYYYKWTDGQLYQIKGVANQHSGWYNYRTWAYFDVDSTHRYYLYDNEVILADPNNKEATWDGKEGEYPKRADTSADIEYKEKAATNIFTNTVYKKNSNNISKLNALKQSVSSFLDAIYNDAVTNNVDHRVAIVEFASDSEQKASLTSITTGRDSLKSVVNNFSAGGATRADLGMQSAYDILAADTRSGISKSAVLFTDGGPTAGWVNDDFSNDQEAISCASAAISAALAIKTAAGTSVTRYGYDYYIGEYYRKDGSNSSDKKTVTGLGGTVYTIGCFDNETVSIRTYMNGVSSNYPEAQNYNTLGAGSDAGYYMNATDSGSLTSIFSTIASSVSEGRANVTLDETSILTDIIADEFTVDSVGDVTVYTADCTGESYGELTFGDKQPYSAATIDVDKNTVTVSNFDYADNWCGKQTNGNYGGKKLIVEVTVKPVNTPTTQKKVYSNKDNSGIGESGSDPSFPFDKPEVDTYTYTVNYYKGNDLYDTKTSGENRYLAGATVSENAIDIPGYTVDESSKSLKIDTNTSENVIDFYYTVNDYTITYDYNDGETDYKTQNYTINDTVTIESAPTREHYNFNGWLIETTDGNWPDKDYTYEGGEELTEKYGNVTLKAKWTELYGYALNFDPNAGTDTSVSGMPENRPETWEEIGTKTYNWTEEPTRTGYTFLGWAETADGEVSDDITDNKTVSITGIGAELVTKTLYAQWEAIDYTITYDANGGELTDDETQDYTIEDDITIASAPTRDGYTFTGWNLSESDADGNWDTGSYDAKDNIGTGKYGNVKLVAQWNEDTVTIYYKVVGPTYCGTVCRTEETLGVKTGVAKGSTAAASTNYKFVGWYSDKDCTQQLSTDATYVPSKPDKWIDGTTYYAKFDWNVTDLTITKAGCDTDKDPNQSFIFTVTGPDDYSNTVVINGNDSVTIKNLTVGSTYTVTEDTSWSWRYEPAESSTEITLVGGEDNSVTITNTRDNDKWLSGDCFAINTVTTDTTQANN